MPRPPAGPPEPGGAHPGGHSFETDPAHCGVHVHIGLGQHTAKTLRNLVNLVNAKEDLLTQALAIDPERREQWCAPVNQRFLRTLNERKPANLEDLARIWYNDNDWERHACTHYDSTRYRLLNLHAVWQKGTTNSGPSTAHFTPGRSRPTSSSAWRFPTKR